MGARRIVVPLAGHLPCSPCFDFETFGVSSARAVCRCWTAQIKLSTERSRLANFAVGAQFNDCVKIKHRTLRLLRVNPARGAAITGIIDKVACKLPNLRKARSGEAEERRTSCLFLFS